jgi:hypothetical protein
LTQQEFIAQLFCRVDDALMEVPKDPRAKLWPSELVTLGILFALRGQSQRRFHQWLWCNFRPLFPNLPERTRLFRLVRRYESWADRFLAQPTLINFSDSLGMELVHLRREGRTKHQVGKKGKSIRDAQARRNGRWIVGVKFCPLVNGARRVVDWDAETANMHDGEFQRLLKHYPQDGKMTDKGFHRSRRRGGDCANLLVCERGQCNVRITVKTVFSNWVRVWAMKKIGERKWPGIEARLAFACAAWNLVTDWATQIFGGDQTSLSTAWVPL